MVVSAFLLCFPSACSIVSYIQYLIHWLLSRTPFTRTTFVYGLFQTPGLITHMLWFKRVKTVVYTKRCLTQSCYTQTQRFTLKPCSCWAYASAVCSLQDSSFHGGRRTTPKAVKFHGTQSLIHNLNLSLLLHLTDIPMGQKAIDFLQ